MDPLLDDFISYEYQENPIQGGLFDPSYFLTSPFSDNSNHPSIFTNFLPESPYNLQSPPDMPQAGSNVQENAVPLQQGQAETSARNKRQGGSKSPKEGLDLSKLYIPPALQEELGTKLNVQSKKISKQTKSTECNDSEENADQKKMSQMLKNRISAQNSRDKKKIYLQQLEGENMVLKQEKVLLLDRIQRIESDYARVLKENEVLKNNGSYICSQCGCSAVFENIIDPVPSVDNNTLPTPGLSRAASRSGAFGFSYSFTTVLLLIFMMTSSEGEQQDSSSISLPPIINTNTRILDNYDTYKDLSPTQDLSPLSTAPGSVILEESFESQYGSLSYNGMPILSQFESMMDDFDANHEKFYEAYELNNNSMVNLSQPIRNATALSEPADLSSNSSGKAFLSKPIVKSRNKTSTLFCPTGFEFFRSSEEEYGGGYSDFSFLGNKASKYSPQKRTLSLDKADYVQLLIPRNSISRLSVSGNSSEIDRSTGYNNSNDEGVIQVWAKIFAVKGLSRTF